MAILRTKEIRNMNEKTRESKLKDLRMELIKANVAANRTNAKTKEIKRAISRILTLMKENNEDEKAKVNTDKKITKSDKEAVKQTQ